MYHGVRWRQHPLYQAQWGEAQLFFVGDFVTLSHPCNLSIGPVRAKILQFYTKVHMSIIIETYNTQSVVCCMDKCTVHNK